MAVEVVSEVCTYPERSNNSCTYMYGYVGFSCRPGDNMAMSLLLIQGQDVAGGGEERPWKDWVLEKEMELRLEVPEDMTVDVKVGNELTVTDAPALEVCRCVRAPASDRHC